MKLDEMKNPPMLVLGNPGKYVVTRDSKTLAEFEDEGKALAYLHGIFSGSYEHAVRWEGYNVVYPDGSDLRTMLARARRQRGEEFEEKKRGRNPGKFSLKNWNFYAGGTGVPRGVHSYDLYVPVGQYVIDPVTSAWGRFRGYRLTFLDSKGMLVGIGAGAGLWKDLGMFRDPRKAARAAEEHFDYYFGGGYGPTSFYSKVRRSNAGRPHATRENWFSVASGLYWFANDYHGGQTSVLYSILSARLGYEPGPLEGEIEPDDFDAREVYDYLEGLAKKKRWGEVDSEAERLLAEIKSESSRDENPRGPRSRFRHERLESPSSFDPKSFRTVRSGRARVVVGCPKGQWDPSRGICKVGTRAQAILRPRGGNPASGPVDEGAADELRLYVDNTSEMYPQKKAIIANLQKKMRKGTYDPTRAEKLWLYWVDDGARRYLSEFGVVGQRIDEVFNLNTRKAVARDLARHFEAEEGLGAYDSNPEDDEGEEGEEDSGVVTYELPVYWASYLINGDDSGLEPGEKKTIDRWLKKEGYPDFVDVSEDVWFSRRNDATNLGGDVAEYKAFPGEGRRRNPYLVKSYKWGTAIPEDRVYKTLRSAERKATSDARMYVRPPIHRISEREYFSRKWDPELWRPKNPLTDDEVRRLQRGMHAAHFAGDRAVAAGRYAEAARRFGIAEGTAAVIAKRAEAADFRAFGRAATGDEDRRGRRAVERDLKFHERIMYGRGNGRRRNQVWPPRPVAVAAGSYPAEAGGWRAGLQDSRGRLVTSDWFGTEQAADERAMKLIGHRVPLALRQQSAPQARRLSNPSTSSFPAELENDSRFRKELAIYRERHGAGPVTITKVRTPEGFPKFMSAWGHAPEVKYDAPRHSTKGKRIHVFGEGQGRGAKPLLASSAERGPKFLAFVGGKFKANGDWIYD